MMLEVALPPRSMFLRYPLITFFSHVAAKCAGVARVTRKMGKAGDVIVLECPSVYDLRKAVEDVLALLLSGGAGFAPNVSAMELRNKLQALRLGKVRAGFRCEDVSVDGLVECYLDNVVRRLSPEDYAKQLSEAFESFVEGYKNDNIYGSYSPPSILVPESVEAIRVFGATDSKGTQLYPRGVELRERVKLGLHSIVAGLAGLWLGGVYIDIARGMHGYVLLASEDVTKDIVDKFDELVGYLKAKGLSDIAVRVLATLVVSVVGGRVVYAEFVGSGYRCDLTKFDVVEIDELAELARRMDAELRERLIEAIAVGGELGEEIARRLFIAATLPRQRYNAFFMSARRSLFSDEGRLTPKDFEELLRVLESAR